MVCGICEFCAGYPIPLHQEQPQAPVALKAPQKSIFGRKDRPQSRDDRDKGCIEGWFVFSSLSQVPF